MVDDLVARRLTELSDDYTAWDKRGDERAEGRLVEAVPWLVGQVRELTEQRDEAFSKGFEQVRRRCVAAEAERNDLAAALQRVRDLHEDGGSRLGVGPWCSYCQKPYPCPTVAALGDVTPAPDPRPKATTPIPDARTSGGSFSRPGPGLPEEGKQQ